MAQNHITDMDLCGTITHCAAARQPGQRWRTIVVLLPVFSRQIVQTLAGELKLTAAR